MLSRLVCVACLAGTAAGLALAQPPKPKDPPAKTPGKAPPAKTAAEPKKAAPAAPLPDSVTDQVIKTADGVKLAARLYRANSSKSGSVVIMIPAYGDTMDDAAWTSTALGLSQKGFNVLTFDHRGFGRSTDIVPGEFWLNRVNAAFVNAGGNPAAKSTVTRKDFKAGYYPQLVQDLAAARASLDQLNDTGEVNTSTVYLLGAGDAASLGLFFMASEWLRERQKPNVPFPAQVVTPRRGLFAGSEPAGQDYGGAVWISPSRNSALPAQALRGIVLSPYAINLRTETPTLFIAGAKDAKGVQAVKSFAADTLAAGSTSAPGGVRMQKATEVYTKLIDKADAASASGLKLLATNAGTEELIEQFLTKKEEERRTRTRQARYWEKPLIIDVQAFGLGVR